MSDPVAHHPVSGRSKVLAEDEVRALSGMYDIGAWLSWSHEAKGHANVSFLIETATGKYVLRRSNPRKSLSGIRFEVSLVDFLRKRGYPAPEVIPVRDGERFCERMGTFYLLSRLISGGPYDPENPSHLLEAARRLGTYHGLVRQFPDPVRHLPAPAMAILGPQGNRSFAEIEKSASRLLDNEEQKRLVDLFSCVRRQSEQVHHQLEEIYPRLLKLAIHGSYGRSALIFDGDTIVGVVDYDRAAYEIRALDLAYSIKEFCFVHGKSRKELHVALDYDHFRLFLAAYQEVEPLPGEELQVLPLILRMRHVVKVVNLCNSYILKDAAVPREERQMRRLVLKLEREATWLEWLAKHHEELVSTLRAG